jgi:ABC-type uncharacterized transport system substrate-binding protein
MCVCFIGCESAQQRAERESNERAAIAAKAEIAQKEAERKKEEEEARKIKELLGEEVTCNVGTVGYDFEPARSFNASITNCHTFINRKNGTLTIMFDYDFQKPQRLPLMRFLVRMFDQNGQYLTHFTTEERYAVTNEYANLEQQSGGRIKVIKLQANKNILQYPVNMRDASFIAATEFGIAFK